MDTPTKEDKFFIYVLKLEHGKYYVGRTHDLLARMNQHQGRGLYPVNVYIQAHPVEKILRVIETTNYFEEDMYTKMHMAIYGIDNVRGGSYTYENITLEQRKLLERELNTASPVCRKCGSKDHFTNQCTITTIATKDSKGSKWTTEEEEKLKMEFTNKMPLKDIAVAHNRSPYAIKCRLEKLGLM